ncbi:MAG: adenylate/guanylate cyclase domain-containing protein [Actinomycetota bacterium]|nr:adenylate/guanylate cyclase domain-containing protein [Actinomycetota bacterium]
MHAKSHGEREVERLLGRAAEGWPPERIVGAAVRTVMFTDIVDSTLLTQELGDDGSMRLLTTHDRIVRQCLDDQDGREVKHTGDGIMASFDSVSRAIAAALRVQERLAEQKAGDRAVRVRVGLAAGEPVAEAGDLFGVTVQLAARICGAATPGEVWVSNSVRELAAGKGFASRTAVL